MTQDWLFVILVRLVLMKGFVNWFLGYLWKGLKIRYVCLVIVVIFIFVV